MRRWCYERLKALDCLVVADFFLSETAELADVVLPCTQWAEEEGTMTNLEGRVLRRRKAIEPPAGVRSDLEILCGLGQRLGHRRQFSYACTQDVFEELRCATRGGPADYSGITYERVEAEQGVFWPCPSIGHPGTPRLFADAFPTPSKRARFHAVSHRSIAEETNAQSFRCTSRLAGSSRSTSPARRRGALARCTTLRLSRCSRCTRPRPVRRESRQAIASCSRRDEGRPRSWSRPRSSIREDTVFAPFHWGGAQSANRLTNAALDPTSKMPEFKVCATRIDAAPELDPE